MRMTIEGDLRFCSHHETMRAVERAASRARLALKFSQGFNPRPSFSLPCPRPVGVASRDDLLVLDLDEAPAPAELIHRLNAQTARGMAFDSPTELPPKFTPQPRRADYRLGIPADRQTEISRRVADLNGQPAWVVQRPAKRRRGKPRAHKDIDLRPLVDHLACQGPDVTFTLLAGPKGIWARPSELLDMLGLDGRADLARLVRLRVHYAPPPGQDTQHNSGDAPCAAATEHPSEASPPRRDDRGQPPADTPQGTIRE